MNKMMKWSLAVACAVISTGSVMANGDGGPLIDALVKKGVLSSQEGEEIRADMTSDLASTPGGMISWGSSAVKGVKIYGDARARFQWESKQDQTAGGNPNADRNRFRYRLRVGADYQFAENWNAGVRFETANANDSTNANFGGYFDKTGDELFVGLVYLQYATNTPALFGMDVADSFAFTIGKQKTPFMLSNAFWDGDINPEGLSEEIGWTDVLTDGLGVTLRGGQYIVAEQNESGGPRDDGFLFVGQSEFAYSWASKQGVKVAPMFLVESNGTFTAAAEENGAVNGENPTATLGNFFVLALPVEVAFNTGNLGHKVYGTYGMNLSADARSNKDLGIRSDEKGNNQFFNVGYQIGMGKGKGAWTVSAEYRYIEAASYSTNLSDSDFAKNELNQQGTVLNATYSLTDNISTGVTWFHSNDIDSNIDVGTSDAHVADVLQVDVMWKF